MEKSVLSWCGLALGHIFNPKPSWLCIVSRIKVNHSSRGGINNKWGESEHKIINKKIKREEERNQEDGYTEVQEVEERTLRLKEVF